MKIPHFTVSRTIPAPVETVWALLSDTESWPMWGPSVRGVECRDGVIAKGSTGRVHTSLGPWVPFEITEYEPPPIGRWAWRVGPIGATGHRAVAVPGDPTATVVSFEIPAWAAPYAPVCIAALSRIEAMTALVTDEGDAMGEAP
ncbi:MAG: SRPBCC family protein [Acidimicrobiales bacterium]